MMFHGMIAVNHGKIPVRALADTGASHCYVSQSFVEKAGIPVRPLSNWLKLANGSNAVSNGTCTLSLDIQTYCGPIECFILPLSDQFDLIIGDDWCNEVGCEISYRDQCLRCVDLDGVAITTCLYSLTSMVFTALWLVLSILIQKCSKVM